MEVRLVGKKALVTGGSGAIGAAICRALAAAGAAEIALTYFSDREGAEATAEAVRALGSIAHVLRVNLADAASTDALVPAVAERLGGRIDLLVSNAASGVFRPIAELERRHLEWPMNVNAFSLLRVVQGLCAAGEGGAPLLADQGRIVALSSLGAARAIPLYGAVGASKAALEAIARQLCLELGPRRITVNVVSPGLVITRALDHFPNRDQLVEVATRKTPAPRLTTPEDVADLVVFLCSAHAAMISGQTLHVDGGYSTVG